LDAVLAGYGLAAAVLAKGDRQLLGERYLGRGRPLVAVDPLDGAYRESDRREQDDGQVNADPSPVAGGARSSEPLPSFLGLLLRCVVAQMFEH
jgi:hypothetical protein